MSLFSAKPAGTGTGPGLFGNSNTNTGSNLFGNTNTNANPGNNLFGANAQSQPAQPTSLFGSTGQNQNAQGGGAFGSNLFGNNANTNANQQTQTANSNLFGANNQTNTGGGLFGSTQNNNQNQSAGIFGSTLNNNQQNHQQAGGLFGSTQQQQQQPQQQQQGSLFGNNNQQANASQQQQQQPMDGSLWQPGSVGAVYEKTIPQQMLTLLEKWSPESPNCVFQRYLYNSVPENTVIYHRPNPGDDEQKWEEALANKPDNSSVPVLCKGFPALGERLVIQAKSVQALQQRLHEIFQSITAINQAHEIDISVRAADAKRKHVALSQRCLRLATKVQVLRNRGYVMDAAEEDLRKKLDELERQAFDPALSGRQEEIWARLVNVRERARYLQEEMDRSGANNAQREDVFDEALTKRTKEVLNDYDKHIGHLRKEIDAISSDFKDWETSNTAAR